jgi:hypothetical protein
VSLIREATDRINSNRYSGNLDPSKPSRSKELLEVSKFLQLQNLSVYKSRNP